MKIFQHSNRKIWSPTITYHRILDILPICKHNLSEKLHKRWDDKKIHLRITSSNTMNLCNSTSKISAIVPTLSTTMEWSFYGYMNYTNKILQQNGRLSREFIDYLHWKGTRWGIEHKINDSWFSKTKRVLNSILVHDWVLTPKDRFKIELYYFYFFHLFAFRY